MHPRNQQLSEQQWQSAVIVVLDFETCGPDPATCAPVEIAAVRFKDGVRVAGAASLINPGCHIPEEASAIHGITDAMVADAPTFPEALLALNFDALCRDAWPCGYHGQSFDRTILHRLVGACDEYAATDPDATWLDPLVVVRHLDRYVRGKGRHKLGAVCQRRGIKADGAHRALADAEMTGLLLYHPHIRRALGDASIANVLQRQVKRAAEQDRDFEAYRARMRQAELEEAHRTPDQA